MCLHYKKEQFLIRKYALSVKIAMNDIGQLRLIFIVKLVVIRPSKKYKFHHPFPLPCLLPQIINHTMIHIPYISTAKNSIQCGTAANPFLGARPYLAGTG